MKQISVICHTANPITEVTELLSAEGLDIRDLKFQQLGQDSILSVTADDYDKCLAVLAAADYSALSDETVLIRTEDRPGALANLSRTITELGVEIRSLSIINICGADDIVAVSTSDNLKVRESLGEILLN